MPTKEDFIEAARAQDESVFIVEKENGKIYFVSDMELTEEYGLRIESMRFEIFIDGARDFLEETDGCRGRNCGGICLIGEYEDDDVVREDFYDFPANGFLICSNDNVYAAITDKNLSDGYYFILLKSN